MIIDMEIRIFYFYKFLRYRNNKAAGVCKIMLQLFSSSFQIGTPLFYLILVFFAQTNSALCYSYSFKYKPVTSGPAASLLQACQMTCGQKIDWWQVNFFTFVTWQLHTRQLRLTFSLRSLQKPLQLFCSFLPLPYMKWLQ